MDKPRPGKTTFVIMVSPLPGKYELLGSPRPRLSRSPRFTRTVTSLSRPPHPRCLRAPRPSLARRESNLWGIWISGRAGRGAQAERDRQPLRALLIRIRHALVVTSPALSRTRIRRCLAGGEGAGGRAGTSPGPRGGGWGGGTSERTGSRRARRPAVRPHRGGWVKAPGWSHLPHCRRKFLPIFVLACSISSSSNRKLRKGPFTS